MFGKATNQLQNKFLKTAHSNWFHMDKIRIFIGLRGQWMYRNGLRVGDVALCCT